MRCSMRGGEWLVTFLLIFLYVQCVISTDKAEPKISLDTVWAASDTITVTLITTNLTDHKVVVSVKRENDSSVTVLDHLPIQPNDHKSTTRNHQHKISSLSSNTGYKVCVSASDGEAGSVMEGGCYNVRTLPKTDNITGLYAAGLAVAVFLASVLIAWIAYKTIWIKCIAKLLPKNDKYEVEQPRMEPKPTTTTNISTETVNTNVTTS